MKKIIHFLTLFTSVGTLLCCALPALIVFLGFGASLAGFLSQYPSLIWITTYKGWIFAIGGGLLSLGGFLQYKAQQEPCPIDKDLALACTQSRKWSLRTYILSATLYLLGFQFAYILPYFM